MVIGQTSVRVSCSDTHNIMVIGETSVLVLGVEHYVVPTPTNAANSAHVYAANMTENPRSLICGSGSSSYPIKVLLSKSHFKIMITFLVIYSSYCCEDD